jgi:hypothetical protein
MVLELTAQGSLYSGYEWVPVLRKFHEYQKAYGEIEEARRENYCWEKSVVAGGAIVRMRNHPIGILLSDLSYGVDLDEAVRKYEAMAAPANYKRPKAICTKKRNTVIAKITGAASRAVKNIF